MTFNEPFYYQEGDKTPFCPACWELKNFPIHLLFVAAREDSTHWNCPVCHNPYSDRKDRSVMEIHRSEPPPGSAWG
jgi:hypothetical protein